MYGQLVSRTIVKPDAARQFINDVAAGAKRDVVLYSTT